MNDDKKRFLRVGVHQIVEDIIKSMPDSPTFVAVGVGVVYIPVGDHGDSTVVSGYRVDEAFNHQESDALRDIGETFLGHAGVLVIPITPEKGN